MDTWGGLSYRHIAQFIGATVIDGVSHAMSEIAGHVTMAAHLKDHAEANVLALVRNLAKAD